MTAISQTGPCSHPQKSVLPEEFERPIPSSAGRYTLLIIPALRVNARKNLEIRNDLTENLNVASPKWTSSSWTPGSLKYARMIHGEEDA